MNVDWIYYLPAPARRAAYFGLQKMGGFGINRAWRDFEKWERFSPDELNDAAELRLVYLLNSATRDSAHYRNLGLTKQGSETAAEFLQRFPILTRKQVRSEFSNIVADRFRSTILSESSTAKNRNDWLVVRTGGSTGVPTAVIHDLNFRDAGRATRLAAQKMCGFPLGTRYFKLWGSEQDLLQQEEKLDRRILRSLLGEIPLNAFRAKEEELQKHWQTLQNNPQIRHMMAYVDSAVSLAYFIRDKGLKPPKLETLMACAGTVTAEWRNVLEETFSCDVYDKYGSRECADIACECTAHAGLHIFSPNIHLEIVDANAKPCPVGQPGRILVTLLNNFVFPMIRYEIGDLGILANQDKCPCGRAFPRLESLQGRQDDMLITEDGTLLSSVFVRHFVGVSLNRDLIREWQLEQVERNRFVFNYIPRNFQNLENNLSEIQASFRKALGQGVSVEMKHVPEILPTPTGKTAWIVNHLRKR